MCRVLSICIIVLVYQAAVGEILVEGQFVGEFPGIVSGSERANLCLPSLPDTLILKENRFRFESSRKEKIEIALFFEDTLVNRSRFLSLIAKPGDSIFILIDFPSVHGNHDSVAFFGANADGLNEEYRRKSVPPIHILEKYYDILTIPGSSRKLCDTVFARLKDDTQIYDELLHQGRIDSVFYRNVRDEIISLVLGGLVSHIKDSRNSTVLAQNSSRNDSLIELFFKYHSPTDTSHFISHGRTWYLQGYAGCLFTERNSLAKSYFRLPDSTISLDGRSYLLNSMIYSSLEIDQPAVRRFLLGHNIYQGLRSFVGMTEQYDGAQRYYKKLYPDDHQSILLFHWAKEQNALQEQKINSEDSQPSASPLLKHYSRWTPIIVDDFGILDSILDESGVINFREGTYYVDIWASWCKPCLNEMAYNYELDSLFDKHQIKRLYISIDDRANIEKWFDFIYDYNLGGYHILGGEGFINKLRSDLGLGTRPLVIPRYFWMKDGKIIIMNAARPSMRRGMAAEIQQLKE